MDILVNLDKPRGITSQDAVTLVKRILKVKKAGHCGTLDPLATGVLVICTGEATKIASLVTDADKEYSAELKFGTRTDTYDSEGRVIATADFSCVMKDAVLAVLGRFRGRIMQRPPMYSAIKVKGTPLYKLARKGIELEVPEREVEITRLELASFDPPHASILVECGKGTYIRSLIDDIGTALGCLAHMTGLRRLRVGRFRAEDAARPEEILSKPFSSCTIDNALLQLSEFAVEGPDLKRALNGGAVRVSACAGFRDGGLLRIKSPDGALIGIGVCSGGLVKMQRMFNLGGKT